MQRDVNFFSVYRSHAETERGIDTVTLIGVSLLGACILSVAGAFAAFRLGDMTLKARQASITGYLQSSEVEKSLSTWQTYTEKMSALKSYEEKAKAETSAFSQLPSINSALLDAIAGVMPGDVNVVSVSYSGSSLSLTCTAQNKLSPANFVHALKAVSGIGDASYTAVTYVSDTEYDFSVTCTVKGGAGK